MTLKLSYLFHKFIEAFYFNRQATPKEYLSFVGVCYGVLFAIILIFSSSFNTRGLFLVSTQLVFLASLTLLRQVIHKTKPLAFLGCTLNVLFTPLFLAFAQSMPFIICVSIFFLIYYRFYDKNQFLKQSLIIFLKFAHFIYKCIAIIVCESLFDKCYNSTEQEKMCDTYYILVGITFNITLVIAHLLSQCHLIVTTPNHINPLVIYLVSQPLLWLPILKALDINLIEIIHRAQSLFHAIAHKLQESQPK